MSILSNIDTSANEALKQGTLEGKPLTPGERKGIFTRRNNRPALQSFLKVLIDKKRRSTVNVTTKTQKSLGPGGLLENQQDIGSWTKPNPFLEQLKAIGSTGVNILKVKLRTGRLKRKFNKVKSKPMKSPFQGIVSAAKGAVSKASGGLLDLLTKLGVAAGVIGFLNWIGNPKNFEQIKKFVIGLKQILESYAWFGTTSINNLLSGFEMFTGKGNSFLARIGGAFKLLFGFFQLKLLYRYITNPLAFFKDLRNVFKSAVNNAKLWPKIIKGMKEGVKPQALDKIFKSHKSIFRSSVNRTLKRFMIRLFNRGGTRILIAGGKRLVSGASRIPIIGPLIGFGINLALGEPPARAAWKAGSAGIFAWIGGAIGTFLGPGIGTALGAVVLGSIGDWLGGKAYDAIFGGKDPGDNPLVPKKKYISPRERKFGKRNVTKLSNTSVVSDMSKNNTINKKVYKRRSRYSQGNSTTIIGSNSAAKLDVVSLPETLNKSGIEDTTILNRI